MPKPKPEDAIAEPPVEPPVEPPAEPAAPPPAPPAPPKEPKPHPLEERLSKVEAEAASLRAENDELKATVRKTPWLRRLLDTPLWDETQKPKPRPPKTQ